ncbi:MAG: UDP-N-acetylmuramoyl-tripeptide--D-alanyl-D-alanine ligase [Actinomycetota bacterium]|nr:UDP-N-acetylmuramoyl-tripeptide--D-alanyl-D-alanine ligase [Actinomycetota bacterium]
MSALWWVVAALTLALAYVAQLVRWLRVLQREHYQATSMVRFWRRWSWPLGRSTAVSTWWQPFSLSFLLWSTLPVVLLVALLAHLPVILVVDTVLYGALCPWGLTPRGRTGKLQWTRRLVTVAVVAIVASALVVSLGALGHDEILVGSLVVWLVPFALALAARVLTPYEARRAATFVDQARDRLTRVHPLVVGITGSYGKTSTKNHLADLLSGDGGVVATPKSFNNRAGLSRAINENLDDATRVFVAEMGTYGPGEIRNLCEWCTPDIAVVTAIGPVHLERMKSLDVIEGAKFEITERARVVIVNIDDPRLALWPARLGDRRVRTAGSSAESADVRVIPAGARWRVVVDAEEVATMEPVVGVQPTNVACAIAAALEVGALTVELERRLRGVRAVANRATVATAPSGVVVVDDTFNANPASARASLDVLDGVAQGARRVVVTPGLIELGERQGPENEQLAREIKRRDIELVIVGRTNRAALRAGYGPQAHHFKVRDEAVAWVRESLRAGDAVLYLNDLPDHYP